MDDKDKKIIGHLMDNGRVKLAFISKKVGLPITTVHNRLKRLVSQGIIAIRAEPDRKKLGYGLESYVLVNIDSSSKNIDQTKTAEKIAKIKGVIDVVIVTGSKDMILRISSKDIADLKETVLKHLRDIEGVASTETLVVLDEMHGDKKKLL
ncbi:MAG: Lrp/AsnC family transcriptional regulator [Candidatus Altiarchaeota archaeon]|nr:Lrp/AsnC family transcriptional regulator [Candidatus Altiarchaeota archaeon]